MKTITIHTRNILGAKYINRLEEYISIVFFRTQHLWSCLLGCCSLYGMRFAPAVGRSFFIDRHKAALSLFPILSPAWYFFYQKASFSKQIRLEQLAQGKFMVFNINYKVLDPAILFNEHLENTHCESGIFLSTLQTKTFKNLHGSATRWVLLFSLY